MLKINEYRETNPDGLLASYDELTLNPNPVAADITVDQSWKLNVASGFVPTSGYHNVTVKATSGGNYIPSNTKVITVEGSDTVIAPHGGTAVIRTHCYRWVSEDCQYQYVSDVFNGQVDYLKAGWNYRSRRRDSVEEITTMLNTNNGSSTELWEDCYNDGAFVAYPLFRFAAWGNIDLTINGVTWKFFNIPSDDWEDEENLIIVDTHAQTVTRNGVDIKSCMSPNNVFPTYPLGDIHEEWYYETGKGSIGAAYKQPRWDLYVTQNFAVPSFYGCTFTDLGSSEDPTISFIRLDGFSMSPQLYPLEGVENLCHTHKQDGFDSLTFDVPVDHPMYEHLVEENGIEYGNNKWLIKKVQDGSIECEISFDFLKRNIYRNYAIETKNLAWVLDAHLPTGWSVVNANLVSISRSMDFAVCTDYDVVMNCIDVYGVSFVWETLNRTVTVHYPPSVSAGGEYITNELNLRKLSYTGSTANLITRLYPYGKDGMTIESVNDGFPYVEDFTYCSKVVCGYWIDERYTVPENLLADAQKTLASLSQPVRSYECDVVDIARLNPAYAFNAMSMHKKITLLEDKRGLRVVHQIVEYKEYPDEPARNVITLAAVNESIVTKINGNHTSVTQIIEATNSYFNEQVAEATAMMVSALGGNVLKQNGELLIMDTDNPDTATKVWRWNLNGFGYSATGIEGPYSTAITMNGEIVASMITAGVLRGDLLEAGSVSTEAINQTYKDTVNNSIVGAKEEVLQTLTVKEGELLSAISDTVDYVDNALVDYAKTSEVQQTVDGVITSFRESFKNGTNLLRNSSGLNGVDGNWTYTGTVVAMSNPDTAGATCSNCMFRLSALATLQQTAENLVTGNSYLFTCKVKKSNETNGKLNLIYNGEDHYLYNDTTTFGWTEYTHTVNDLAGVDITLKAETSGNYLDIADCMLINGTAKHSWAPAPDEIYTTVVKIDRNGIEVSNASSETRTVINNTEFAVMHGATKVISVNKDETLLKKSIVDADLTIGKLKFLPLDDYSEGVNIILLD